MSTRGDTPSLARMHPLQRLSSPSRGASALLHVTALASFANCFHYLLITPNPVNESYGWHFQYLTILGLSLATTTFGVGLLADLTLSRRLFLVKNALAVVSTPLEILISLLYWGLRAIDTNLVLPEWAPRLNVGIDLGFHLVPAATLIIDLLFFSPPWTIAFVPSLGISSLIAISYYFWVEQCYSHNGFYPYPIFDEAPPPVRFALFSGSALVMSASTGCLIWLYSRVNGIGNILKPGNERPGAVKNR